MVEEISPPPAPDYPAWDDTFVESPVRLTGLDLTTVREILKAPQNPAHRIFLCGLVVVNPTAAAITVYLQKDTGGTPTTISPLFQVGAYSTLSINFPQLVKVTVGKNVGIKSSSSNTGIDVWIFARG
jgi:hypothetical protein